MIIVCYIAAVAADILSTRYALGRGGFEANPLLRFAGRCWIPVRIAMAAVIAALAYGFGIEWVLWVGVAVYGAVAAWNVYAVRRAH